MGTHIQLITYSNAIYKNLYKSFLKYIYIYIFSVEFFKHTHTHMHCKLQMRLNCHILILIELFNLKKMTYWEENNPKKTKNDPREKIANFKN